MESLKRPMAVNDEAPYQEIIDAVLQLLHASRDSTCILICVVYAYESPLPLDCLESLNYIVDRADIPRGHQTQQANTHKGRE